jgi:hypothetical protein
LARSGFGSATTSASSCRAAEWIETGGAKRVADIFVFDDYGAQDHFERTALAAAKRC